MATHSSTLAWNLTWTEEPGGLQSRRSQRVGQDWVTSLSLFTFMHWRRKWHPTPVFLPGESQGISGGLRVYGVTQSQSRLKWLRLSSISRSKELNDTYSSVNTAPKLPRGSYCVTKESGACCKLPEQVAELLKEFQDPPAGWGQNNTWLKITQNNSVNIKVILVNKMCKKITGKV